MLQNRIQCVPISDIISTTPPSRLTQLPAHSSLCKYISVSASPDRNSLEIVQETPNPKLLTLSDTYERRFIRTMQDIWDIFSQLVKGLSFLHSHKLVHGRLNPDNVFCFNKGPKWIVKMTDFCIHLKSQPMSVAFYAPEVLQGSEPSQESDAWSLGVILYYLCVGRVPFLNREEVLAGMWSSSESYFDVFLRQLLVIDPSRRISMKDLIKMSKTASFGLKPIV
ncbi:hypothetical protein RCL1_000520 [Eukaryota sp. TZLM3-RCL]